ncbi:hypothetical protein ACRQ4C_14795 [Curtobacterium sp. SP.BCp]|uniref:hypothetical protein n=1 Tax=Curtobacterium sp. SP.BCp TaxID=3435230 RepID=UPI003F735738
MKNTIVVRSFTTAAAFVASATLVVSVLSGAPSHAATVSEPAEHCWTEVESGTSMCGKTLDALAEKMYRTHGIILQARPGEVVDDQVTGPSKRAKAKVDSERRATGEARGNARVSYLLIRGFVDTRYRGISQTWSSSLSEPPCRYYASLPYGQYESLANMFWNDTMSSYQVAQGCKLNVYEHTKFRGTKRGPYGNSPDLGILNKKVSSMSLRKDP